MGLNVDVSGADRVAAALARVAADADEGMTRALRAEWQRASEVVAETARSESPSRSGVLRSSIRVKEPGVVRAGARYAWFVDQGMGRGRAKRRANHFMQRAAELSAKKVDEIMTAAIARYLDRTVR